MSRRHTEEEEEEPMTAIHRRQALVQVEVAAATAYPVWRERQVKEIREGQGRSGQAAVPRAVEVEVQER
jgi:hypothetical protein